MFPGDYTIYGSKRSFFTAKLENILRFLDLPFEFIEKGPHDGSQIEMRGGAGVIPLLKTPEDWVLWDSTPIARLLNSRYPDKAFIPPTPVQRIGALILEEWIDEWFTRAAMYTRWNFDESVEAVFGGAIAAQLYQKSWFDLTDEEREAVKPLIAQQAPFREIMTKGGVKIAASLENGQDVMVWFGAFLDDLSEHLRTYKFLLGDRPCVADFSLSGGFSAHFAYDPWPHRFVKERQPETLLYAERCWEAKADTAQWIADDRLPESWTPFFEEMAARYSRYQAANREALANGKAEIEIDLGFGPRTLPAVPYRELSRLDVRNEILALSKEAQDRVRKEIPGNILDAFLLPPLATSIQLPERKGLLLSGSL